MIEASTLSLATVASHVGPDAYHSYLSQLQSVSTHQHTPPPTVQLQASGSTITFSPCFATIPATSPAGGCSPGLAIRSWGSGEPRGGSKGTAPSSAPRADPEEEDEFAWFFEDEHEANDESKDNVSPHAAPAPTTCMPQPHVGPRTPPSPPTQQQLLPSMQLQHPQDVWKQHLVAAALALEHGRPEEMLLAVATLHCLLCTLPQPLTPHLFGCISWERDVHVQEFVGQASCKSLVVEGLCVMLEEADVAAELEELGLDLDLDGDHVSAPGLREGRCKRGASGRHHGEGAVRMWPASGWLPLQPCSVVLMEGSLQPDHVSNALQLVRDAAGLEAWHNVAGPGAGTAAGAGAGAEAEASAALADGEDGQPSSGETRVGPGTCTPRGVSWECNSTPATRTATASPRVVSRMTNHRGASAVAGPMWTGQDSADPLVGGRGRGVSHREGLAAAVAAHMAKAEAKLLLCSGHFCPVVRRLLLERWGLCVLPCIGLRSLRAASQLLRVTALPEGLVGSGHSGSVAHGVRCTLLNLTSAQRGPEVGSGAKGGGRGSGSGSTGRCDVGLVLQWSATETGAGASGVAAPGLAARSGAGAGAVSGAGAADLDGGPRATLARPTCPRPVTLMLCAPSGCVLETRAGAVRSCFGQLLRSMQVGTVGGKDHLIGRRGGGRHHRQLCVKALVGCVLCRL